MGRPREIKARAAGASGQSPLWRGPLRPPPAAPLPIGHGVSAKRTGPPAPQPTWLGGHLGPSLVASAFLRGLFTRRGQGPAWGRQWRLAARQGPHWCRGRLVMPRGGGEGRWRPWGLGPQPPGPSHGRPSSPPGAAERGPHLFAAHLGVAAPPLIQNVVLLPAAEVELLQDTALASGSPAGPRAGPRRLRAGLRGAAAGRGGARAGGPPAGTPSLGCGLGARRRGHSRCRAGSGPAGSRGPPRSG